MDAQDIIDTAEAFAERAGAMLATLQLLPARDRAIFEGLMDQVADNKPMGDEEWRLFANTARLAFYGVQSTADERLKWRCAAAFALEELREAAREDAENQAFDFKRKARQEVA